VAGKETLFTVSQKKVATSFSIRLAITI